MWRYLKLKNSKKSKFIVLYFKSCFCANFYLNIRRVISCCLLLGLGYLFKNGSKIFFAINSISNL
jgi:hypothetical protein